MYTLEGESSVANLITAYEESKKIRSVFFVSKGNLFGVYFTTLQLVLVSCGGSRTSPNTSPLCSNLFDVDCRYSYGTCQDGSNWSFP